MKTILTYKLNGTKYRHVFETRVAYASVERYLIMERHIGLSKIPAAIVEIENLLT